MIIRPAQISDAPAYLAHMKKHMRESGGEGRPVFHPMEDFETWKLPELVEKVSEAWAKPVTEAGWERKWLLDDKGVFLGDAHLRGPQIATSLHRCELGVGVQESARGLGHGSDLIEAMLSWAQTQESLFWVDLHVFAHNRRAIELYESIGFQTYGMTMDLYRVHGHSIDDVHMSLQLREE